MAHMPFARVAAALTAAAAAVALVGFVVVFGAVPQSAAGAEICASSGPVAALSEVQAKNARTIVAVATPRGGRVAAQIATMTAITESNLKNLGNPNDPNGTQLPNEGWGYDHDSLGLFQQRPGWGSAAQRMDPIVSTGLFLDALLEVSDWQNRSPWVVAQQVQRSAFSDGSNYLVHAAAAARIVDVVLGTSAECEATTNGQQVALPAGFTLPAGASPAAQRAVSFALAQLGKPYVWGAEGPDSYDCSGLMQTAWRSAGVSITRVVGTQMHDGVATDLAHLASGDLIAIPGSLGSMAAPGHVGMYIGSGRVVEAPHSGDVVKVVSLKSYIKGGVAGVRHIA
jgi:cell wall-associated NlpC family hydrolase